MTYKEVHFKVFDLRFSGQHFERHGVPVIALHGWLDNAASFNRLAHHLPETNFLALDLAGHGFSDHRPKAASYAIWDDVAEVLSVAHQMGWEKFSLIGHSRGAANATLIAAVAPERVTHLTWLDGGWPMVGDVDFIPQLRKSVEHKLRQSKEKRIFPTIEHAITARRRGMFQLSYEAAKELTMRGIEQYDGGYRWRSDARLMDASEVRLTSKQMQLAMTHIRCDIMMHCAQDDRKELSHWRERMSALPNVDSYAYRGSHHLHMEEPVIAIAEQIKKVYSASALADDLNTSLVKSQ